MAEANKDILPKTEELETILKKYGAFDSELELQIRSKILEKLDCLLKNWIKVIAFRKNIPEADAHKLGGKVLPFGSFRLGVHQQGADIDAVCLAPSLITYNDYFSTFFGVLQQRPEVTECRAIQEAFVPVIKMKFDGVEVDLLFARLALDKIPEDIDLSEDKLLQNIDIHSVRSLNGRRVTDEIMKLVPDIAQFRLVLRVVKLWAKRRGIYSNALGFFGGVTWAMLVARICQLYPELTPNELIAKFFLFLAKWSWPSPIFLKYPSENRLGLPIWDTRVNKADRSHLMPVITPAYPQQNSTFNVTKSTKKVMLQEFKRAMHISKYINANNSSWEKLFEQSSFIFKYQQFVVLSAESNTAEDQLKWRGLLESKTRILVKTLEEIENITLAHGHPNTFESKQQKSTYSCTWLIGVKLEETKQLNVDIIDCIQNFTAYIKKDATNKNLFKEGMTVEAIYLEQKHLDQYLHSSIIREEEFLKQRDTKMKAKKSKNKRHLNKAEYYNDSKRHKFSTNYEDELSIPRKRYYSPYSKSEYIDKYQLRSKQTMKSLVRK